MYLHEAVMKIMTIIIHHSIMRGLCLKGQIRRPKQTDKSQTDPLMRPENTSCHHSTFMTLHKVIK